MYVFFPYSRLPCIDTDVDSEQLIQSTTKLAWKPSWQSLLSNGTVNNPALNNLTGIVYGMFAFRAWLYIQLSAPYCAPHLVFTFIPTATRAFRPDSLHSLHTFTRNRTPPRSHCSFPYLSFVFPSLFPKRLPASMWQNSNLKFSLGFAGDYYYIRAANDLVAMGLASC